MNELFTIRTLLYAIACFASIIGTLGISIYFNFRNRYPFIKDWKQENPKVAQNVLVGFSIMSLLGIAEIVILSTSSGTPELGGAIPMGSHGEPSFIPITVSLIAWLIAYALVDDKLFEETKTEQQTQPEQDNKLIKQLEDFMSSANQEQIMDTIQQLENRARLSPNERQQDLLTTCIQLLSKALTEKKSYDEEMSVYDDTPQAIIESTKISLDDLLDDDGELKIQDRAKSKEKPL